MPQNYRACSPRCDCNLPNTWATRFSANVKWKFCATSLRHQKSGYRREAIHRGGNGQSSSHAHSGQAEREGSHSGDHYRRTSRFHSTVTRALSRRPGVNRSCDNISDHVSENSDAACRDRFFSGCTTKSCQRSTPGAFRYGNPRHLVRTG
jgi:hypothetical protein